eukprot:CAMPEP_0113641068 /NCGR_PEP_ID=MMETSP0017_2-20120614/21559_1 /TAXON_ID=2856 /ORGANISM="Cylindrotheca closterium" /LENGTH=414 /DNA_ID=CAMNT_0000552391 /DNA_START=31 /DNA_END=1275 /DNA_ORIENTATION=- /assembly_acc=CAM_ASM_000147
MSLQDNNPKATMTKEKKSKKKGLIGMTISFSGELMMIKEPNKVDGVASIADESLFTHTSLDLTVGVPEGSDAKESAPRRKRSKKLTRQNSNKSNKSNTSSSKGRKSRKAKKKEEASKVAPDTAEAEKNSNAYHSLSTMIRSSMIELENERYLLQQGQEETSNLLKAERIKNLELQTRIIELEHQQLVVDPLSDTKEDGDKPTEEDDHASRINILEAENYVLKQKTERQEQTITVMGSEMKQQMSMDGSVASRTLMSSSWTDVTSLRVFMENESVHSIGDRWESLEEADSFAIPTGAKAQGEILQLRSTLGYTSKAYGEQAEELSSLKQEVEALRKQLGLETTSTGTTRQKSRPLGSGKSSDLEIRDDDDEFSHSTAASTPPMPYRPTLKPELRLSQSDLNDMTRQTELANLLDF